MKTGMRQEGILLSVLFSHVIDHLLKKQDNQGYGMIIGGDSDRNIFDQDFDNNIALIDS